jgi:hypothetical protein
MSGVDSSSNLQLNLLKPFNGLNLVAGGMMTFLVPTCRYPVLIFINLAVPGSGYGSGCILSIIYKSNSMLNVTCC